MQKSEGTEIPVEDTEKLEKLTKERVECLKPVRIRITTYDKVSGAPRLAQSQTLSPSSCPDTTDAVETLQTLGVRKSETKEENQDLNDAEDAGDEMKDCENSGTKDVQQTEVQ